MNKSCEYCEKSKDFTFKEAYDRSELNKYLQMYVQEDGICISLDVSNDIVLDEYIDINFCPMCGRKLVD